MPTKLSGTSLKKTRWLLCREEDATITATQVPALYRVHTAGPVQCLCNTSDFMGPKRKMPCLPFLATASLGGGAGAGNREWIYGWFHISSAHLVCALQFCIMTKHSFLRGCNRDDILKSFPRFSTPKGIEFTYLEGHQNSPRSDSSPPCQPLSGTTSVHSPHRAKIMTILWYVCKTSSSFFWVSPIEFLPGYILYLSVITFSVLQAGIFL